jgi:hypothetical protein
MCMTSDGGDYDDDDDDDDDALVTQQWCYMCLDNNGDPYDDKI